MAVERKPGGPVFAMSPDINAIRERANVANSVGHGPGALWTIRASADDVPALLAEIERLRARIHEVASEGDRRGARVESQLARLRALMHEAGRRHGDEMEQLGKDRGCHISGFGQATAAAIIEERDEARAALAAAEQERDRLAEDSKTLNAISFAAATALGLVPPGIEEILADPVWLVERLIAEAKGIEVER